MSGAVLLAIVVTAVTVGTVDAGARVRQRRDLPPSDRDALAALFDPMLAPLGLRITRATLQNLDTYRADPNGRHLAVYVEPIGAYSDAQYVTNFTAVAQVFLPMIFERWKGLKSFDVCQEPLPAVDSRPEPAPVTQLAVNRRGARRVHWRRVTLADILAAVTPNRLRHDTPTLIVYFKPALEDEPAYVTAARRAGVSTTTRG